jgi:hypothetical protein
LKQGLEEGCKVKKIMNALVEAIGKPAAGSTVTTAGRPILPRTRRQIDCAPTASINVKELPKDPLSIQKIIKPVAVIHKI